MKKSILILAIILLGGIAYGQDSTATSYGIELVSYPTELIFGTDTISTTNTVSFVGYIERSKRKSITFFYEIKSVKDSVESISNVELVLPQSYVILGKTAYQWYKQTMPKVDTTIFKGLAKPLYIQKVLKK